MMQMLRKAAVAVLFTILIVAFAISMGGNNYFDRYTHASVAKVGSIEITPEKYDRAFQRTLENLSNRAKQQISQAQARALGLPQQVLQGLIQEAALDYEAQKLGLGLSKQGLSETIKATQGFQDSAGNFDRSEIRKLPAARRLQRTLLRAGIPERSHQAADPRAVSHERHRAQDDARRL